MAHRESMRQQLNQRRGPLPSRLQLLQARQIRANRQLNRGGTRVQSQWSESASPLLQSRRRYQYRCLHSHRQQSGHRMHRASPLMARPHRLSCHHQLHLRALQRGRRQ